MFTPPSRLIAQSHALAIVGCAFRFPGARSRDALWEALVGGRDLVTQVEPSRFAQAAYRHPRKSEPGTSYTFAAGSLGDVAGFDAAFFGISPREAIQMDPQQRILLELAWETCEDAGIPPSHLRGTRCGVFLGISGIDYGFRRADDLGSIEATTMTGNTASIAANRLSYCFDLHGPSMALDTACSSSLVAFHQACRSVQDGESSAALAGAIGLHLHPFGFIGFSKASMLSRRGLCAPFAADADGYVRSEGGGLVLIKRLDQAVADGDRVLAVVLGTGLNTDGRKNGLTVPSPGVQATLLREVYQRCGISPDDIDYLEAHGTGTAVGDPLEARALADALGRRRAPGHPLPIGSVKSNLGHLEVASGMAGLVKAMLCLEHRAIPPTIHLEQPHPKIDFVDWNLHLVTDLTPLDARRRLVVGVSSFGFGGANAHVVLASPAAPAPRARPALPAPPLLLSARGDAALQDLARAMATHLRARPDHDLYDIAAAAAFRRDCLPQRLAVFGADRATQTQALTRFAEGEPTADLTTGQWLADAAGPVFVYAGNGSQWLGMGRLLLTEEASFHAAITAVDALFTARGGFSILAELAAPADAGRLAATEVAQPLLFAVQVGLTRLLAERGITPAAVVGHSVGEVAAAWACGALTLEQAVEVMHVRSTHQGRTRGSGAMTAAALGAAEARALIESLGLTDRLSVAGINSARSVTLAGPQEALAASEAALNAASIWFRRLDLEYAFHSPAMDPLRADLSAALANLAPGPGIIPFYSTATGSVAAGDTLGADYWWRNVREPVRFAQALNALLAAGLNCFVEIGPSPILRGYLHEALKDAGKEGLVLSTLTRDAADRVQIERCFHQLLMSGIAYDWTRLFPHPARFVDLPRYPWQHERYWQEGSPDAVGLLARYQEHPLLGHRRPGEPWQWENHLDTCLHPQLADHAVGDAVVFPAAGFAEMALAAAALWHPERASVIEGLEIAAPLLLALDRSKTVRFTIDSNDGRFTIRSRARQSDDPWALHATGQIAEVAAGHPATLVARHRVGAPDAGADLHYRRTHAVGLEYGPAFRAINEVWVNGEHATATLITPAVIAPELANACLHPAYLDAAFQLLVDLLADHAQPLPAPAFVPIRLERLRLFQAGAQVAQVEARLRRVSKRAILADFRLYDGAGNGVAVVDGVRLRAVQLKRRASEQLRRIVTVAVARPHPRDTARSVRIAADDLAALTTARWCEPERLAERSRYLGEVEPLLDALCAAFAQRALRLLEPEGTWIDPHHLLISGVLPPSGEPLLHCLLRMLTDDGVLAQVEGRWLWRDESALPDPQDIWISLMSDYPDYAGLIGMAGRAGLWLPEVLTGAMDPEQLLVADADLAAIGWFGSEPGLKHRVAATLGDLIGVIAARLPPGRHPRILEFIGPAPEAVCLTALLAAPRCDLVVAAPTAERCRDLATLLRRQPAARTCIVNPGEPAAARAELGGWFDLVLLGSGLAGGDPVALLAAARALLAQDGVLVVCEHYPTRAHDLSFGLHPDWWSCAHQRPSAPRLRTPEAWQALLAHHGFPDTLIVRDMPAATSGNFLMFAHPGGDLPCAAVRAPDDPGTPGPWCLMVDATPFAAALSQALSAALHARGQDVLCIVQADSVVDPGPGNESIPIPLTDPAAWQRVLADLQRRQLAPRAIVHLAGLAPESPPRDAAHCLQRQEWRAGALLASLQGCAATRQTPDYWVITSRAGAALLGSELLPASGTQDSVQDAPLWALARVAMNEFPGQRVRWIDLAERLPAPAAAARLADELLEPDDEDEIVLVDGARFAPRLRDLGALQYGGFREASAGRRIQLEFSSPGSLRNLGWQAGDRPSPAQGEVEIAVRAVGLNFRDVMYSMGLLPDEALENGFSGQSLGMELAGVISAIGPGVTETRVGEDVIAFAPAAFASHVITRVGAVVAKPSAWTYAAAATVPTAFFTAYFALTELARLEAGERILIHGAAGGVGLAALQIAKMVGAEVFATAGTPQKRDIVRMLGADHVLDSRTLAFADEILEITGGTGVDVVLNSLTGEAINRNLRILRPFGRFLELGKRDFYENTHIALRPFRNNITYFGIDADQVMSERPVLARRVFRDLMSLFGRGILKPLPYRVFDADEVVDAFRYMQHSRQIGKVVVTVPPAVAPASALTDTGAPLWLHTDATYLVTGGLSGFGLRTAQWLAAKGARTLVLLSRRGEVGNAASHTALAELRATGVTVYAPACDITDCPALTKVLDTIAVDLAPLRGVIHAAMVIDDCLLRTATPEQLHRVLAPKVLGALHLDRLTRELPLDFFVLYSSATTLFGNPGQGAYVAANMTLEAVAADRRTHAAPATCIAWGPIADVGYLARNTEIRDALVARMGGTLLRADDALTILEQMLTGATSNLAVLDLAWGTLGRVLPSADAPKFSELGAHDHSRGAEGDQDLRRWLDGLGIDELQTAVTDILRQELADILRLGPEKMDVNRSVYDMGMDSLMGFALATALDTRLGISLPLMALREGPTIARLTQRIVHQLRPSGPGEGDHMAVDALTRAARQIAEQHGDTLDPELIQLLSGDITLPVQVTSPSLTGDSD